MHDEPLLNILQIILRCLNVQNESSAVSELWSVESCVMGFEKATNCNTNNEWGKQDFFEPPKKKKDFTF